MKHIALLAWVVVLTLPVCALSAEPADVDGLIRELRSIKVERRVQAAEALGELGALAAPAVRSLTAALHDPSPVVQIEALLALGHIGSSAKVAVPDLVNLVEGDDPDLKAAAIETLGSIGHDARDGAPALLNLLKGEDESLATSAGLALARILPEENDDLHDAIPVLVRALKSDEEHVRSEAVAALAATGKVALPLLIKLVKNEAQDGGSAWQAAAALQAIGPRAHPAIAALVAALKSNNENVVVHAAGALGAIGPAAKAAVPNLQKLLDSQSALIRTHAASALGDLGPAAVDAVEDLAGLLEEHDEGVRREAAEALGKIGPAAKAAVPALLGALEDDAGSVTVHAAWALSRIGPEAVPQLLEALNNENLRQLVVAVLGDIGPAAKSAVDRLTGFLSEPDLDPDFGREVLLAFAKIGPDAKDAAPALLKILGDEENSLRPGAAYALAKMGIEEAVPLLLKALPKVDDPEMRIVVPVALMLLNPEKAAYIKLALPRLIDLLGHETNPVRYEAAAAIARIGPRAAAAVPTLSAALEDPDAAIRGEFLTALGAIGPDAAAALPAILKALADHEPAVRSSATYAIGQLGGAAKEAIPLLERNLTSHDEFLQFVSAWALVHVDPKQKGLAERCLAPLLTGLKSHDPRARSEAAEALGLLGPSARPAVPALKELAQDKDQDDSVREAVAAALKKIVR